MATTKEVAYFCPDCGGASIEASALAGGRAECKTCKWEGSREKLVAYAFQHEFSNGEEALRYMMNDIRSIYGAAAKLIGEFLMKWGFLDTVEVGGSKQLNTRQLARYVAAMAQATLKAVVEERAKMEKERTSGN